MEVTVNENALSELLNIVVGVIVVVYERETNWIENKYSRINQNGDNKLNENASSELFNDVLVVVVAVK